MRCPTLNELPPPPPGKTGWPWTEESPQLPDTMPDGHPWPRVSIVTPSLNQGQFIEETIRSVLLQGYPNLEYIIIDGGSTDNTVEIIQAYEGWISNWVSEKDRGQSDAINKGWKKSNGDILAWINADDIYCPGAVNAVVERFCEKDDVVLVCGAGQTFDVSGTILLSRKESRRIDPYAMLKQSGGVPMQPSVFLRRRVLDEVGHLNTQLHYVMDWEYWIRIGLHYRPEQLEKTNRILSNNREWPETKTNKGWRTICQEHRQVFDSVFRKFPDDSELQRIKRRAYSASYRKEASLASKNEGPLEAIKSLFRAWCLAPLAYNPAKELAFLVSVIIGQERVSRLKKRLSNKMNRLSDHQAGIIKRS
jgi:glycosyltransferase involved in cell wall biosynthesis